MAHSGATFQTTRVPNDLDHGCRRSVRRGGAIRVRGFLWNRMSAVQNFNENLPAASISRRFRGRLRRTSRAPVRHR